MAHAGPGGVLELAFWLASFVHASVVPVRGSMLGVIGRCLVLSG